MLSNREFVLEMAVILAVVIPAVFAAKRFCAARGIDGRKRAYIFTAAWLWPTGFVMSGWFLFSTGANVLALASVPVIVTVGVGLTLLELLVLEGIWWTLRWLWRR